MAVENKKSPEITNLDATPPVRVESIAFRGVQRGFYASVEVAAADDDNSVFRLARVRSSDVILSLMRFNDAITGATVYDLGVYETAANGGAVVSQELFGSDIDISAGTVVGVEHRFEAGDIADGHKKLWQLLALSADPNKEYDIAFKGTTVGSGAGTLALRTLVLSNT